MKLFTKRNQAGFTIIEVMIVLAIAGVIMLALFLAVPALQRSNRNTQRRNDAAKVAGFVNEYITNNNGRLPTAVVNGAPANATQLQIPNTSLSAYDSVSIGTAATNVNELRIVVASVCNQNAINPGGARSFAVSFNVETQAAPVVGQAQCI